MGKPSEDEHGYPRSGDEEDSQARVALFKVEGDDNDGKVHISSTMVSANSASGRVDRRFLYIAACTANIASFFCGTAFGWTSPEIPKLKGTDDNPTGSPISQTEEGWVGSSLPLAAAIGPFAAGFMADRIGRKKTLLISAVPFAIAFALNVFANNVFYFFASRFLCGIGVGIIFTVLPMYIGEIADDDVRGTLGSFMQLFIVIGLLFSYAFGPYLSIKLFNIILVVFPILFFVLFFMFIPESPYFLIHSKDIEEAEAALCKLRAKSASSVQKEMETIRMQVEEAQENKANFFDIFKSKGLTRALFLSVSLVTWQQFSGINIILFYTQDIFTDAGVSLAPAICTIIIGVVQIFGSSLTPILVEKKGKRFLLMLSGLGMAIALAVLAFFFYLKDDKQADVSSIGWLPIVSLIFYIFAYCFGFGPLPWAVMGELFPGNIKSVASTVTASVCWILGFLLTNYFGAVADIIGKSVSFGIFSVCCVIAIAFVFKLLPETSGKSLQEIQDILNGNSNAKE